MSSSNKIDNGSAKIDIVGNVLSNVNSIISIKPVAKYASGARTVLKINGNIAAFATSITWNIETSVSELRGIDDYLPIELAPRHVSVRGTIGGLMIPGNGVSKQLIQSDVINFLQQRYVTIEVKDSQTDNLLFYTSKALITSRVESLNVEQLGKITLSFQAIGWKDDRNLVKVIEPK